MDINDMTPVGGGDLRGPEAPSISKSAGTFTPTASPHPDLIWNPRGGELAPPGRPLSPSPDAYTDAPAERPVPAAHMADDPVMGSLPDTHRAIRAALRPGYAG